MSTTSGGESTVIVTHCIGVTRFWIGGLVAGRETERDREAEFASSGTVDSLVSEIALVKRELDSDLEDVDGTAPIHDHPGLARFPPAIRTSTKGLAIIHAYEELAQHHGHLDITRDILLSR